MICLVFNNKDNSVQISGQQEILEQNYKLLLQSKTDHKLRIRYPIPET